MKSESVQKAITAPVVRPSRPGETNTPETGRFDRDQAVAPRGFYPGVPIPLDRFREARGWQPGKDGTS